MADIAKMISILEENTIVLTKECILSSISTLIHTWLKYRRWTYEDGFVLLTLDDGLRPTYVRAKSVARRLYINSSPDYKIGSEQWLYLHFESILPPHTLIENDTIIEDNSEILFLDDWSLSGNNTSYGIEEVLYRATSSLYTIIAAVITDQAILKFKRVLGNEQYQVYRGMNIEPFDEVLERHGFSEQDLDEFNTQINPDTMLGSYAILSEYKIPNQYGSYPNIYEDIYEINRDFMNEVRDEWNSR